MNETEPLAAIARSLELYVEKAGDPAALIYEQFFARHPCAAELFGDDDDGLRKNRMMDRLFTMILELAGGTSEPAVCVYWVPDHVAWEVSLDMIHGFFEVMVETLRDGLGPEWNAEMEAAWRELIARMLGMIEPEVAEVEHLLRRMAPGQRLAG